MKCDKLSIELIDRGCVAVSQLLANGVEHRSKVPHPVVDRRWSPQRNGSAEDGSKDAWLLQCRVRRAFDVIHRHGRVHLDICCREHRCANAIERTDATRLHLRRWRRPHRRHLHRLYHVPQRPVRHDHFVLVDNHECREPAEHAEPHRHVDDLGLELVLRRGLDPVPVLEIRDARPPPQMRDCGKVDRRRLERHVIRSACRETSRYANAPRGRSRNKHRCAAAVKQVRYTLGREANRLAVLGNDRDVRHDRPPDLSADRDERTIEIGSRLDECRRAAAEFRNALEKAVVDGGVDSNREESRPPEVVLNVCEHTRLVADLAVGQQDQGSLAFVRRRAAFRQRSERRVKRRVHLRAAARFDPSKVAAAAIAIRRVGGREARIVEPLDRRVERQDGKAVRRTEPVEQHRACARRRSHLFGPHRARPIQHKEHVAWNGRRRVIHRRVERDHAVGFARRSGAHEIARTDRGVGRFAPAQNEVAVQPLVAARQSDSDGPVAHVRARRVL